MWPYYLKFGMGGLVTNNIASAIVSVLFCLKVQGNFDSNYLYYPFRFMWVKMLHPLKLKQLFNKNGNWFLCVFFSLPWNQKTAIGYSAEIFISIIFAETYMIVNGGFLLLYISTCFHHNAFYQMFKYSLQSSGRTKVKIDHQTLCKLVGFYVRIKEWVEF